MVLIVDLVRNFLHYHGHLPEEILSFLQNAHI